jgi:hypothetical protein
MAYIPAGEDLTRATLLDMWTQNPDGGGFMYNHNGRVVVKKGFAMFLPMYAEYKKHKDEHPDANFIVHFRISTGGKKDYLNCHPHIVDKNWAFAHNGILGAYSKHDQKDKSDTVWFNEEVMKKMPKDWEYNDWIVDQLGDFIGYNKLAFLRGDGEVLLINEQKGVWRDKVWMSNANHERTVSCGYWNSRSASNATNTTSATSATTKTEDEQFEEDWNRLLAEEAEADAKLIESEDIILAEEDVEIVTKKDFECSNCCNKFPDHELSSWKGPSLDADICVECAFELVRHVQVTPEMFDIIDAEYWTIFTDDEHPESIEQEQIELYGQAQ